MDDEQERRRSAKRPPAGQRRSGGGNRARAGAARAAKPRIEPAANPRRSRSLEYGIAILECYSSASPTLGIAELSDLVGISRSTTHRYAMTLLALGYLEQDAKRKYRLATRAGDPGLAAIETLRSQVKARAVLEELREQLGHTVSLAVLSDTRAIYVHRLFAHGRGQYDADRAVGTGASVPLPGSAVGKALLASLQADERAALIGQLELTPAGSDATRARRAFERALARIEPGEPVLGDDTQPAVARSLAVAVPRLPGAPALAIEVTVPAGAGSASRLLREMGPRLKRAARLIGGD